MASLLLLLALGPILGSALVLAGCSSAPASAPDATTTTTDKVTVAGDSISVGLGASLRGVVGPGVEVKVIGEEGSGLARPDRFDWTGRLIELARDFPPTVLVLSTGSNDAQDLTDVSGTVVAPISDPAAWDAEYRRRLAAAFDAFAGSETTVVWVGQVRTSDERVAATNRRIHELATSVAAEREGVVVVDLAVLLGTGEDVAARCLMPDGLHLTTACLDEAATALAPQLPAG